MKRQDIFRGTPKGFPRNVPAFSMKCPDVFQEKSPRFPDTIREVLLAPGQFTSVQNWYNRTYPPDEDTLQAVEDALSGNLKPVTGGAVFFYAPRWTDGATAAWFESLPLTLEMEGHRFFGLNS